MTEARVFKLGDLLSESEVDFECLGGYPDQQPASWRDLHITNLEHDSRKVSPGTLFFCIPGTVSDGRQFAGDALDAGARALVAERPADGVNAPQIIVADARQALARVAARFYGHPSRQLRVTGITGTNGKTTSAYVLESILRGAGRVTGLIGTVETRVAGVAAPAQRTTPDALELQRILARMVEAQVSDVVMEVSSHALDLERVGALRFAATAFTNLSQDHLDYHHDMESYFAAKRKLFFDYEATARVINVDDAWGRRLFDELERAGLETFGVGSATLAGPAGATDSESGASPRLGLAFDPARVCYRPTRTEFCLFEPAGEDGAAPRDEPVAVRAPLVGAYNVHNVLIAAGCALNLGLSLEEIAPLIAALSAAPGRLEHVEAGQPFTVLVDYAHTDDALRTALSALRAIITGRLITVFGCGGDRDRSKRPLMGRAAGEGSDYVIATSDNPRGEDPCAILVEVEAGLAATGKPYEVIVDRARAIARATSMAEPDDCVFIAGKGHEDYQIFADKTIHFDDREVALAALDELGYARRADERP